jgi:hypothetical protein
MDFSENFSAKSFFEVQSAHFGNRHQVSIHQGMLYVKDEKAPFAKLSDDSKRKTASAIRAHLQPILHHCLSHNNTKEFIFISDSPSAQHRNRYNMFFMLQLLITEKVKASWFFMAGQSRGAPDGIGAVIKRSADAHVRCGGNALCATDLQLATQTTIMTWKIDSKAIDNMEQKLMAAGEITAVEIIFKAHYFFSLNEQCDHILAYRELYCSHEHDACHCFPTRYRFRRPTLCQPLKLEDSIVIPPITAEIVAPITVPVMSPSRKAMSTEVKSGSRKRGPN